MWVFGTAIPFEEEVDLPVREQVSAPAISRRCSRSPADIATRSLPQPVIETLISPRSAGQREAAEEAVGAEVVHELLGPRPRVAGAGHGRARVTTELARELARTRRRQQVDGGPLGSPGMDPREPAAGQAQCRELPEAGPGPVLTGEEQPGELLGVEVPVGVEGREQRQIPPGEQDRPPRRRWTARMKHQLLRTRDLRRLSRNKPDRERAVGIGPAGASGGHLLSADPPTDPPARPLDRRPDGRARAERGARVRPRPAAGQRARARRLRRPRHGPGRALAARVGCGR